MRADGAIRQLGETGRNRALTCGKIRPVTSVVNSLNRHKREVHVLCAPYSIQTEE
jgi:hypothetical protein